MISRSLMSRVSWLAVAALAVSCSETGVLDPPTLQIQDGGHPSGNAHFFFLPPIVKGTAFAGVFDPSLTPVVDICEWNGSACGATVARFFTAPGSRSETVRVDAVSEAYVVNWHTGQFDLQSDQTYRLRVLLGALELGHADVDVVSRGNRLRNLATGESVPLLNGRTLPIAFRIEIGAVPHTPFNVVAAAALSTTSIKVTFDGPPDPPQAADLEHYALTANAGADVVSLSGTPVLDGNTVTLSVAGQLPLPLLYVMTVSGVTRAGDGEPLSTTSATFHVPNGLLRISVVPSTPGPLQDLTLTVTPTGEGPTNVAGTALTDGSFFAEAMVPLGSGETGGAGAVALAQLPGASDWTCRSPGLTTYSGLQDGGSLLVEIELPCERWVHVMGAVWSLSAGPLSGVRVTIEQQGGIPAVATTGSDGRYYGGGSYGILAVSPTLTLSLSQLPPGYSAPVPQTITLNVSSSVYDQDFVVFDPAAVHGDIITNDGRALDGVTVTVTPDGGSSLAPVIADIPLQGGVSFDVHDVPVGSTGLGSGVVTLGNLPTGCFNDSGTLTYAALAAGGVINVVAYVYCNPVQP